MDRLLLLDADVIINLHTLGYWDGVVKQYEVYVGSIIARETKFYPDSNGNQIPIDMAAYIAEGSVKEIEAELDELRDVKTRLPQEKIDIHDGELEAIAVIMTKSIPELRLCLADHTAIKAVAYLEIDGRCICGEQALKDCGIVNKNQEVPNKILSKKRYDYWITQGKLDLIAKGDKDKQGSSRDVP